MVRCIRVCNMNFNFQIFSWLVSTVETFLHEHNSMGTNLAEAREFLASHKSLQRDLRVRDDNSD